MLPDPLLPRIGLAEAAALSVAPGLAAPVAPWQGVLALAAVLVLAAGFASLRSALARSAPSRVLERARSDRARRRLAPLLLRADALRTSASAITVALQFFFVVLLLDLLSREAIGWGQMAAALLVGVPLVVFLCEVLPQSLRADVHDRLLARALPLFHWIQLPLAIPVHGLELTRRLVMRALRIPERPRASREIVEGLRHAIEEAALPNGLAEAQREILENVIEFHDVDVAEIMTPRTEIAAVEVGEGLAGVVRAVAESGHSRIPVHEGSLDSIVGAVEARDVIRSLSEGELAGIELRAILRPVVFVPETKLVSELLEELRRDKQRMAIVLDEYGGTAGLVTLSDILAEIVGELQDEFDVEPEEVHVLGEGVADVRASARISDVNEALDLDLSEDEDYETLAGFVLAELGRFPRPGEGFLHDDVEYTVREANDRRVLVVRVRKLHPEGAQ